VEDDRGHTPPASKSGKPDPLGETGVPSDAEVRPSLLDTENSLSREFVGGDVRVAKVEADRLRALVGAKLFGGKADPVKIGRFTVLSRLGAGGMGVVYAAYDEQLDRKVAIKLLRSKDVTERQRARLMREAQALARLSHPNVIHVYEVDTYDEQVFVAMEFVKGETLRDWEPKAGVNDVLEKYVQAGRGLAAAHAAGLVHRDFKPENALVGDDGRVRVLDFGLARAAEVHDSLYDADEVAEQAALVRAGVSSSGDSLDAPLTKTGAIMGTPAYMSPEQHLGVSAGPATDQFSFCVALWERIYGRRPFEGESPAALALNVTGGKIKEGPSGRQVPTWLRRALIRGLQVRAEDRYPSMEALLAALARDRMVVKRGLMAGALALVTGISVYMVANAQEDASVCAEAEFKLAGVWDEAAQTAVQGAFVETGVPYADDAWQGTVRQLDEYTQDWIEMHNEACEAHLVRSEEDAELYGRRMVCLGQRLHEVEQLTALLRDADVQMVQRAVDAASSLSPLTECADATRLMASEATDEKTQAEVDEVDKLIAKGQGKLALGQYADGLEIARQAVDAAQKIDHPQTEGRALYLLGRFQARVRELEQAEATLKQSVRKADRARDDMTRVRATIELVRVVGYQQENFDEGEALAEDARAALERVGKAPVLEAFFYTQTGSMMFAEGDYEEAAEQHGRALKIREDALGSSHTHVAMSLNNVGNAMTMGGRFTEAEGVHRRAHAIFEKTLGDEHPYTAISLNNIGNSLLEQGRKVEVSDRERAESLYREAEGLYRRAIAIRERNFGTDHPVVSKSVHNLGEVLRRQGKYPEALAQFERALAIKEGAYGAEHPSVAMTLTGVGRTQQGLGRRSLAAEALERALEIRRARGKTIDSSDMGETLFALAMAVVHEDPERARELAGEAREAYARAGDDWRDELVAVRAWLSDHSEVPAPERGK
jgi:tetratricopeptide (TPR) repeat protein/tRNA A-37 threonylcarbamoyl transferase component Bud32